MRFMPSIFGRSAPAERAITSLGGIQEDNNFAADTGAYGPLGFVSASDSLRNPDTFAALRDTSATVARLPINIYRRDSQGKKRRVTDSIEQRLINKPGGSWTRQMFWQFVVRSMETNGRCLALVARDEGGRPVGLHPTPAHGWKIDMAFDEVTGTGRFRYIDPKQREVPFEDVLDFVYDLHVDSFRQFTPISPVKYAGRMQDLFARGEQKISDIYNFVSAIFVEIAAAGAGSETASYKERISALRAAIRFAQKNGYGIIPIDPGSKVDQSSVTSAQQNQLIEMMEQISVQASKHFSTSPVLHGDARGSYRNAEGAMLAFTRLKVAPFTNIIEQEIENKLLLPGEWCEFGTNALLKGDVARESQRMVMLVSGGILTPNQALDELGYEASDDPKADVLNDPQPQGGANMQPGGQLPEDAPSGSQDA